MEIEKTKAKEIAALPLDERRQVLEQAAERAACEYKTNRELTVFSDHIISLHFFDAC